MNSFKKVICGLTVLLMLGNPLYAGQLVTVDQFKGLASNPQSDKQADGSHTTFNNVYVNDGNIQVVKGRSRLNSTAHTDAVVNMMCYYESSTGTKKLVVKESDEVVTYDTDGTNRTQIANTLTNEAADCVQEGDTLYFTSVTDGLYKWTGSGSASAITGVSAPSSVDFSATTGAGGMTSGLDAVVTHTMTTDSSYSKGTTGVGTCTQNFAKVADRIESNTSCGSLSANFNKSCATSSTYSYKVSKWNSQWAIESEASSADTATLTGADTVNVAGRNCFPAWSDSGCSTSLTTECLDTVVTVSGEQTRTTGTLASAPSAPFDGYCIYRTVAGGVDYFKQSCIVGGGSTYTDGKPDVVLGDPLDTTIDTIDPPKARYVETYKGVLVLGQGNALYFSRLPVAATSSADTYWLASDKLLLSSDNVITSLQKVGKGLLIFTKKNIYELTGFGVKSFRLNKVVDGLGAISDETIEVDSQGDVLFFSGSTGVYKLRTFDQPEDNLNGTVIDQNRVKIIHVSSPSLDDIFNGTNSAIVPDITTFTASHAYYDRDLDLYFLYIGSEAFLYANRVESWSHLPGTYMLASVYRKSSNSAGQGVLVDNLGFFYNNWTTYANGGMTGTVTGNPTSSTSTTLTCSGCTFNTTNDGLKGVWVIVDHTTSREYRQISSNTGTVLTVSTAWTSNPTTSDTFYIGYIMAEWQTKQYTFQKPPKLTAMQAFTLVHNLASSAQSLTVDMYTNKSSTANTRPTDDPIDLSASKIQKLGFGAMGSWFEFLFRTYVYSTSTMITPPVDVINYTFRVVPKEDE